MEVVVENIAVWFGAPPSRGLGEEEKCAWVDIQAKLIEIEWMWLWKGVGRFCGRG